MASIIERLTNNGSYFSEPRTMFFRFGILVLSMVFFYYSVYPIVKPSFGLIYFGFNTIIVVVFSGGIATLSRNFQVNEKSIADVIKFLGFSFKVSIFSMIANLVAFLAAGNIEYFLNAVYLLALSSLIGYTMSTYKKKFPMQGID